MWQQQRLPLPPNDAAPDWLEAGYYQHIPHGEVNWALLAQQWITMRQVEEQQNVQRQLRMIQQQQHEQQFMYNRMNAPPMPPSPQPPLPPMQPDMPPPPPSNQNPPPHFQPVARAPLFPHPPPMYGSGPGPGPVPGEMPVLFPSGQPAGSHFSQQPLMAVASQAPPFHPRFGGNAPGGREPMAMNAPGGAKPTSFAPSLLTTDFQPPPGYIPPASLEPCNPPQDVDYRSAWPRAGPQEEMSTSPEPSMIDLQMRKQLPAWIRDGLEKMEKGKQKQHQTENERNSNVTAETDKGSRIPKWRLEDPDGSSDTEQIQSSGDTGETSGLKEELRDDSEVDRSDADGANSSDAETTDRALSAEEIKEELLAKLRYWMTSILLEVTSTEITNVVQTFYNSSRAPAQPKVLAQSSALASILGFFDEDERDSGTSPSDTEATEDTGNNSPSESFKVPMLPPPSTSVSVSKKIPTTTTASNGGKLDSAARALASQGETKPQTTAGNQKSMTPESEGKETGDKTDGKPSTRVVESKQKKEHARRRRSHSRSKSRERGDRSEERRKHSRSSRHSGRSRSRSPSSTGKDKRRRSRDAGSRSHKYDSDRRKYSKERSKSPSNKRRR